MAKTLVINNGEYEFTRFERAVATLEEEYGYEGLAWDMVAHSEDFEILEEFLNDDGLIAEIEDEDEEEDEQ